MSSRLEISDDLVSRLLAEQFPPYTGLSLKAVENPGWDNASFRLGDDLVVRLPRAAEYAPQPLKEHRWLPVLAPHLPLEVPEPTALGIPTGSYPWHWSIRRWIGGHPAHRGAPEGLEPIAKALAAFLRALQAIPPDGGPAAGHHSFYRGSSPGVYDQDVRNALGRLTGRIDGRRALKTWEEACATNWAKAPVWVHGDISPSNLLVQNGKLAAVIDFGQLAVGDPSCDLAIAWAFFDEESRKVFHSALGTDNDTWRRGRAWALWKALITVSGRHQATAVEGALAERTLDAVLRESTDA